MPTVPSSTERLRGARSAAADVGHVLGWRARTVRRRRGIVVAVALLAGVTAASAVVPALVEGAGEPTGTAVAVRAVLPLLMTSVLLLATGASLAGGGGRELLPRDQLAIHPVSTTAEHLGALVLAPLNLAWLVQAWTLLGATAFAVGPGRLVQAQLLAVLWLLVATALAQVLGWWVEAARRGPRGLLLVRVGLGLLAGSALLLQLTGRLTPVVQLVPTGLVAEAMTSTAWPVAALVLSALLAVAVPAGAWPARVALRRTPREEVEVEAGRHPARPMASGRLLPADVAMLRRMDRASVWRSVPMRRGILVLALGPGLVALAIAMPWVSVLVLPGVVSSGGALLFGVNAWCLDGRGLLWRESLPARPSAVFAARALVMAEWLLTAAAVTVVLASLRSGRPTGPEVAALLCTWLVVTLQVVAVAMTWSGRRPFAVDLRSARATPAPPVVMVGYSARLALGTTLTAVIFAALSAQSAWWLSPVVAVPFLAWSAARLLWARRRWLAQAPRAAVVAAVTA